MIDLSGNSVNFQEFYNMFPFELADLKQAQRIDFYEYLFSKALVERAHQRDASITEESHEKIFPHIKNIISWLRDTDFYTAPASTKYHDAFNGGLLYHTLSAYLQLATLKKVPKFEEVVKNQWWSAVFVILVHDWCKIGRYESYWKRVQDDKTEVWSKVLAYRYKDDNVGRLGHGPQSLVMAMQLCNTKLTSLTFEEMASIRWHMDNWDMASYDIEDLKRCNEKIPMVRMIQFADQLAITSY